MILLAILGQVADPATAVPPSLSVTQRCVTGDASDDITVCGRRDDTRYRIPVALRTRQALPTPGTLQGDLVRSRSAVQEMGPFLVGGGMTGVKAGVAFGPGAGSGQVRTGGIGPPAP